MNHNELNEIEISVLKYDELFTRRSKDIKRNLWFSFPNDLMTNPDFFEITGDEFKAFIWCVSMRSKHGTEKISLNIKQSSYFLRIDESSFSSMLEKLKGKQIDVVHGHSTATVRPQYGRSTAATEQESVSSAKPRLTRSKSPSKASELSSLVNKAIRIYCELWKNRYQSERSPDVRGKDVGILKSVVKDLGFDRTEKLLRAYLEMPDSWFVTKRHDLPTFSANMNSVALFADSGRLISKAEVSSLDQKISNQNTLAALHRGDL